MNTLEELQKNIKQIKHNIVIIKVEIVILISIAAFLAEVLIGRLRGGF